MSQKRDRVESKTGAVPRIGLTMRKAQEPEPPPTLPEEKVDMNGVTGAIVIRAEGEDRAKDADDAPTRSAPTA